MGIILTVILGLVALAALFFVVAGISITMSGMRARRGVKGDIALTGFFAFCFVLAAGGCALVALPEQAEQRPNDGRQDPPRQGQPRTEPEAQQPTREQTAGTTTARSEPESAFSPSLAFDCKDFTNQEAAQKALEGDLGDPDILDPDADRVACEGLEDPDTKPEPDPEKNRGKESKPDREPDSKDKRATKKGATSEKKSAAEEGAEPENKR